MPIVRRAQWGARASRGATRIAGPVRGVTCHWEGPAMGYPWPHDVCDDKVRSIQRYHMDDKGWADIAYNALACPHGYVYEGRGPNVRSAANGESGIGGNDQWYAVCYLAGVGDEFTAEGQAAMLEAIAWLRSDGGAGEAVNGHRDHHPTDCPGDVIYRWVQTGLPPDSSPVLEDDMPLSSDDLDRIAARVWARELGGKEQRASTLLIQARDNARAARRGSNAAVRQLSGLAEEISAAIVADLPAIEGLDAGRVRQIVYAQASRAINNRLGSLNDSKE